MRLPMRHNGLVRSIQFLATAEVFPAATPERADIVGVVVTPHVFDRALQLERQPGTTTYDVDLDKELWVSDVGPWGGYVAALFTKAISDAVPELSLVSLTVHFVRRFAPGHASLAVTIESRGSRAGHVTARLCQGDRPGAVAVATVGNNPQDDFVTDFACPAAPPPDEVRRRTESSHPYMQHLDVRPTVLVRPWAGHQDGTLAGWIRLAEPRPLDLPLVAALPDGWTPGTWARLTQPAGKVTVDMTIHFRAALPQSGDGWCFIRVRTRHVERGFADEECEIWSGERLLAQSRQLVLLAR